MGMLRLLTAQALKWEDPGFLVSTGVGQPSDLGVVLVVRQRQGGWRYCPSRELKSDHPPGLLDQTFCGLLVQVACPWLLWLWTVVHPGSIRG